MNFKWAARLIGIILFAIILSRIDIDQLYSTFSGIGFIFIVISIFGVNLMILIKAKRWHAIMQDQDMHFSMMDCFLMYYVSIFIGAVSPGKIGEFSKVFYLKKEGFSWAKSFASVIMDRIFDISALILLGYLSMFFFISIFANTIIFLSIFLLLSLAFFLFIFTNKKILKKLFKVFIKSFVPKKIENKTKRNLIEFYRQIKKLKLKNIISNASLTISCWIVYYLQLYILLTLLNIKVPLTVIFISICISALVAFIPISIVGIGTRDAALIFVFALFGQSKEHAITLSLIILLLYFIEMIGGMLAWLKKPVPFDFYKKDKKS